MGKLETGPTETLADRPAVLEPRRPPELVDVKLPSRFTPRRVVGAGAMGYVVEARDESLGRDVAVKVIAQRRTGDPRSRDRFLREARAVAQLRHDNIVTIHDLDPRGQFIVMELITGDTLKSRIAKSKLEPAEVRRIGKALLDALGVAHAAGIVHRDVKPANVLLGEDGSIKLADFGVAATSDSELTNTGEAVGTPAYMAPEQLRGQSNDRRVDIYATGATLFEAATGERLHTGRDRDQDPRARILESVADRGLAEAIARAVRDKPSERFADVHEFARALLTPTPLYRRTRFRIVLGALVAIAIGVGVAVATYETKRDHLALGIAALERQELAVAAEHLRVAPDSARAYYYRGLLGWWTSKPTMEVVGDLYLAIEAGLDERLESIAWALLAQVMLEYPGAITKFEALGARYPDDREVLYGLFESLFHGGRANDALEVYAQLHAIAPGFGLGRHHALTYYLSRGNLAKARWALAGASGLERIRWQARIDAAAGDFAAARKALLAARASAAPTDATALGWDLVAVDAQAGELDRAQALARELAAKNLQTGALPLYALALVRGTTSGTDAPDFLAKTALDAARLPLTITTGTREAWLEIAMFAAIDGDSDRARAALDALQKEDATKFVEVALARVLLLHALGDRAALDGFAKQSPFVQVRAAAVAALADPPAAAETWQRALDEDGFGRAHIALRVQLARAKLALGDQTGARAACDVAIHPTLFHWSWGAAVVACNKLTATRTPP